MKSPEFLRNGFNAFKNMVFTKYGEQPGKMLVHTGTIGWILSALAQISVIAFNDNIPKEQKRFLIPQECWDALTNIVSFYLITQSARKFAVKLVKSGKLITPSLKNFVKSSAKLDNLGKWDFDITKLNNFSNIEKDYKKFKKGIDITATIIGSIASCNIITPIVRNKIASVNQQKYKLDFNLEQIKKPTISRITMNDYLSGNMKI